MSQSTAAIIIPAHNEAAVIGRCLDALAPLSATGTAQVIVACNGCQDSTAQIARQHPGVTVLEIGTASKTAALRAADLRTDAAQRVYLDADVVLSPNAAVALIDYLRSETAVAARPPVAFDTAGAAWPVRRWYAVRSRLPSIQGCLWGAGVYALSERGRTRFGEFPDVVADDLFVNDLYAESEIAIVPTDPVIVSTPRKTRDLVRILKRKYRSQSDGSRAPAGVVSTGQRRQLRDLTALLREDPGRAGDCVVYVALILVGRIWAILGSDSVWERDNSSRVNGKIPDPPRFRNA
jgi:glycosyltransferase involved in cell wall biosynthesis